MNLQKRFISKCKNHRGATALIFAIILIPLLGITALAIDVGYVAITRNELQNIADATVLAAVRQMGKNYAEGQIFGKDFNKDDIVTVVNEVAGKNKAGGEFITISDADVTLSTWPSTEALSLLNAVEVTARRDDTANNPITTFFAKIFDIYDVNDVNDFSAVNVSASATAALSGLSKTDDVELPVGISKEWFDKGCEGPLTFRPDTEDDPCIAWHCFSSSQCKGGAYKKELWGIIDGTFETPEIIAGETEFDFRKGMYGNAFDLLEALYEDRRFAEEPHNEWTTTIVVYDWPCDKNTKGLQKILGFASITITGISGPPGKEIVVSKVACEIVVPGRGGGGEYGTYGDIPGLVE